jgi:uncharacterized protein (TIGR02145 family)
MKKLFTFLAFVVTMTAMAQSVAISDDGSVANGSAILDVKSTTKGFLPPRMTVVQRDAIASPASGLQIWCSDCAGGETQIFNGSTWTNFIKAEADRAAAAEEANAAAIGLKANIDSPTFIGNVDFDTSELRFNSGNINIGNFEGQTFISSAQVFNVAENIFSGSYVEFNSPSTNFNTAASFISGTLNILNSPQVAGHVLTDVNGDGNATWQASKGQSAGTAAGDMQYWNGTAWVVVAATTNEGAALQMIGGVPTWVGGTAPPPPPPLSSVTIGEQTWTDRNLDVATYRDGTAIPEEQDPDKWKNLKTGAWCYYENNPANGATYGKLYNWYAVMGITTEEDATPTQEQIGARKELAPAGWHVPSDEEWTTLADFLGGTGVAGGKMKETGEAHWKTPNTSATNSSGFTAFPGGNRSNYDGTFSSIGTYGYLWSSSESNTTSAWFRFLWHGNGSVYRVGDGKPFGCSVRCLRN